MSEQHNQNEEVEYFFITNEEGTEEKFEILYEFDHPENGYSYLLLIPFTEEAEEDVEVYPIRYKMVDDQPVYETIETDEEWGMVEEVLQSLENVEENEGNERDQ